MILEGYLKARIHASQLVNYDVNAWEGRAYEYGLAYLRDAGCNVDGMTAHRNGSIVSAIASEGLLLLMLLGRSYRFDI